MANDIEEWDFSYDASGMRTARTDGEVPLSRLLALLLDVQSMNAGNYLLNL